MTINGDVFAKLSSKVDKNKSFSINDINTPLGDLTAIADDEFLYFLGFLNENYKNKEMKRFIWNENKLIASLKNELKKYFDGKLMDFKTPVKYFGTDFQQDTWCELSKVKFGETLSYSQLAVRLGKTSAHSRAVGACAGANPLLIIIPCHRLIAANDKLGGFSAGLNNKTILLNHEKKFK